MIRPTIIEHNTTTDEIIERQMNDKEFAQYKTDQVNYDAEKIAKQAEAEAKATAKAALLARLGITADEAKLLLA